MGLERTSLKAFPFARTAAGGGMIQEGQRVKERETFASRLGFVLISAGCAIGLGNVWRFPYIVGQYGGAAFVLLYLVFLVLMGLPIMAMEFSVGRASRRSVAVSFHVLEPKGSKWHWYSWFGMAGNYMLMMFYTNLMYAPDGSFRLGEAIFAAMGQAFFTLSLGIGAMAIFGSYIGKERRLMGESVSVGLLDTFVAFVAGLVIFPSAFAFGVQPDEGASLIFLTLPNVFNAMPGGRVWGAFFFVFMSFAALSTVIAVFQNIITFPMEKYGWSRKKAILVNLAAVFLLSLPCLLGFNLWAGFQPLGAESGIMDLEDFILTNNLLPLGSLVYLLFCVSRKGWGWDSFLEECDTGKGLPFPCRARFYMTWILPFVVLFIFVMGYWEQFGPALLKIIGQS